LQAALDGSASYLSRLGQDTPDLDVLMPFLLEQAGDFGSIAQRYTPGMFGLGITDLTITAVTDPKGNAEIRTGSLVQQFTLQQDGTYRGATDNFATLTRNNGTYQLRKPDGTRQVFNADGSLNFVEDTNGNKTVYGYTGNKLTSVTDTSTGEVNTFTYNAQGLVSSMTDPQGRISSYEYDPAGHLLSITDPLGKTSYTYVTGQGAASENALASITNPDGSQLLFTYNSQGQLIASSQNGGADPVTYSSDQGAITATDALGDRTTLFLDAGEHFVKAIDPPRNVSAATYDDRGNPITFQGPGGITGTLAYDGRGNPIASIDPLGHKVTATYDPAFNVPRAVTDPPGNTLGYSYDPNNGNLLSITFPDATTQKYGYDAVGQVTQFTTRAGQAITYTFNPQGLLTSRVLPDGTRATFAYNNNQDLVSMTDPTGTTTFARDAADRITRVDYPNGTFLEYIYNAGGQRVRMRDQTGFTVNYGYDALGRLSKLTDGGGNLIVSYAYDPVGRLSGKQFGNGTSTTYRYDANSNVLAIVNLAPGGAVQSSYTYTYDDQDLPVTMTTAAGTFVYGYDAAGQLTSVQTPSGRTITYQYDAAGNRSAVIDNGATTSYTANGLNEYTRVGTATDTYDLNGDLISSTNASGTTTYTYNALRELTGVVSPTGTTAYQYDGLGFLVSQTVNGVVTNNLIDPTGLGSVVGQLDGSGKTLAHYTTGLGLASQVNAAGSSSFYSFDASGNTTQLTGADGGVLNSYSYLPFGEQLQATTRVANPFTYVGQYGLFDNGQGLILMDNRWYSPTLGRFLNPDPSGAFGGLDLYTYASNSPVTTIDPSGLEPLTHGEQETEALKQGLEKSDALKEGAARAGEHIVNHIPQEAQHTVDTHSVVETGEHLAEHAAEHAEAGGGAAAKTLGPATTVLEGTQPAAVGVVSFAGQAQGVKAVLDSNDHSGGKSLSHDPPTGPGFNNPFNPNNPSFGNPGFPLPDGNSLSGDEVDRIVNLEKKGESRHDAVQSIKGPDIADKVEDALKSHDPNSITGPGGFGPQRFVAGSDALPYRIDFTNEPTATAPAQTVTVTEQLDPNLDLSTFQFGTIGFGNLAVTVPPGLTSFSTRVDATASVGVFVDVTANLNLQTGLVTWTFTSIDPKTLDQPTGNPREGFLPPDTNVPLGEGFATYTVQPKAGDPTGTAIKAQATVVFDTNAPINTAQVTNTLDAGTSTSSVDALPATTTNPNFAVTWSGQDDPKGSGIATFDVFVSDNGAPFRPFLQGTTATSAPFTGQVGHTYAFFSIATDNVGHVQATPSAAQANTTVVLPPPGQQPPPAPVTGDLTALVDVTLTPAAPGKKHKGRGFLETLTIRSKANDPLEGPFDVVLRGLKSKVKVKGAAGFVGTRKKTRSPFVVVAAPGGSLQPGGTVSLVLQFSGKPNRPTLSVFAATPPK
jgi:RHS repeat-associated protein